MLGSNPARQTYWQSHLDETPWTMEAEPRRIVLEALRSVCTHREWVAYAFHIRTTHVHAVIGGPAVPERMLSDFKAYARRALRCAFPNSRRRRYWAHHGSTHYLWTEVSLRAAVHYVLDAQGDRMAWYLKVD